MDLRRPGVNLRASLLASGTTDRERRRLRRTGDIVPVRPGAYVAAEELDGAIAAHPHAARAAVAQLVPGSVLNHVTAATRPGAPRGGCHDRRMTSRALVLGGGGITGIAWELGLLAGLRELGVDLTDAETVTGTSAGSVVGAQVATGVDVDERYAAQLVPPDGEIAATMGRKLLFRFALAVIAGPRSPEKVRARLGALALRTTSVPEQERIDVIGRRLPVQEWPERPLRITAVDAHTGAFRVFDRDSGVPLVHAVAASCAVPGVWPPVTIGDTRYIDGGMRSPVNADLAAGAERVVVLAPGTRGIGPLEGLDPQVERLRAGGSTVAVVSPDAAALAAIGRNVLDPAQRAASARAGRAQAASAVSQVRDVWTV
ncbi:patatin-like phospholipase family protein [Pseudonocardia sp. 73-21]|uniref:patatin-like phospholipase family protein n=1 Tax=Pseudonocardia sp. 73-21 TaxID=1895809 RepID=UPI00260F6D92|nr:patatin-like phospholipase family protein [Pseudonocardia sp. 73-21]